MISLNAQFERVSSNDKLAGDVRPYVERPRDITIGFRE